MLLGHACTHRMPQGGWCIKSQFVALSFHGVTMPQSVADLKTEFTRLDMADCSQGESLRLPLVRRNYQLGE